MRFSYLHQSERQHICMCPFNVKVMVLGGFSEYNETEDFSELILPIENEDTEI